MDELTKHIQQYIASLSEKEKKAYDIAREHLGTSFQLEKSNGFIKWYEANAKLQKS